MSLIEDLLVKLSADVGEIKETVARNTSTLETNTRDIKEHVKRTNLLEERVEQTKKEVEQDVDELKEQVGAIDKKAEKALMPLRHMKWIFIYVLPAVGTALGIVWKYTNLFD